MCTNLFYEIKETFSDFIFFEEKNYCFRKEKLILILTKERKIASGRKKSKPKGKRVIFRIIEKKDRIQVEEDPNGLKRPSEEAIVNLGFRPPPVLSFALPNTSSKPKASPCFSDGETPTTANNDENLGFIKLE